MGLLSFFADREHQAELRESKDEMLVGEIVRAMSRKGWPTVHFYSHSDYQRIQCKTIDDPVLSAVYLTLDRKTGTGAISSALVGSKATLFITCEVRNFLADPDDLLDMYRTDLANLFKLSWKEVRINHEYNAILGTSKQIVDIDPLIAHDGLPRLMTLIDTQIDLIRDKLAPYKKQGLPVAP